MTETAKHYPVTSPQTDQRKVMYPADLPANLVYKNYSLKSISEFRSCEHSYPFSSLAPASGSLFGLTARQAHRLGFDTSVSATTLKFYYRQKINARPLKILKCGSQIQVQIIVYRFLS